MEAAGRERQAEGRGSELSHATMFTMRLGTTITFLGALPSSARLTPSSAKRGGFDLLGLGILGHADLAAALAVDLHGDGDAVRRSQGRIIFGPGRFRHQPAVAQLLPALFRQMRHHRRRQQHQRLDRFAPRPAVDACSAAADGIGQRVELGHGAVEAQILQIVGHRGDGPWVAWRSGLQASSWDGRRAGRRQGLRFRSPAARRAGQNASSLPRPHPSIRCRARAGCPTA